MRRGFSPATCLPNGGKVSALPLDCDVWYRPGFLDLAEAEALFSEIISGYDVTDRKVRMADGSELVGETGIYLFADSELLSHDVLPAVWGERSPWPDSLAKVRDRIMRETGVRFPVARCVYYRDGTEGMDFHSDLPAYGATDAIASLSLGAERRFVFRQRTHHANTFAMNLSPGSLLFMGAGCQERYEHALPRDPQCRQPRLNLTFRRYGFD